MRLEKIRYRPDRVERLGRAHERRTRPLADEEAVSVDEGPVSTPAMRHFTDRGDRFIKRVAAREGVRVCAEGQSVSVGPETLTRATHDSAGRALPTWEGCRVLHAGEVFLLGETRDSFDSRYFGIVREDAIEGVWKRL